MRNLLQSTAANVMVLLVDSTTHITGKTGATLTITLSKDGGAFASITPTVTERGDGWYNVALTTAHTDTTGDLVLHIAASGADPADVLCRVGYVPVDLSSIPSAATNASAVRSELTTELGRIDAAISTRLATASYTAPDNATITSIDTKVDVAVSTRLASVSYATPPTATDNAIAVRSELATELAHLDADITSRLSTVGYVAPDNTSITDIKTKTDQLTFTSNKVHADTKSMNGATVNGNGTAGNKWRGA